MGVVLDPPQLGEDLEHVVCHRRGGPGLARSRAGVEGGPLAEGGGGGGGRRECRCGVRALRRSRLRRRCEGRGACGSAAPGSGQAVAERVLRKPLDAKKDAKTCRSVAVQISMLGLMMSATDLRNEITSRSGRTTTVLTPKISDRKQTYSDEMYIRPWSMMRRLIAQEKSSMKTPGVASAKCCCIARVAIEELCVSQ